MERNTSIEQAQKLFGTHFIGPTELQSIESSFPVHYPKSSQRIPVIPWTVDKLQSYRKTHLLILGCAKDRSAQFLTLNALREYYGIDSQHEPCFYNQDWYLKEDFFHNHHLENKWYLLRTTLTKESRGQDPESFIARRQLNLPSALLTAYAFFAYYFTRQGSILWEHDFVWCADRDHNGDQIYTGQYHDPMELQKNGFNIHRHLSIKSNYGVADTLSVS